MGQQGRAEGISCHYTSVAAGAYHRAAHKLLDNVMVSIMGGNSNEWCSCLVLISAWFSQLTAGLLVVLF